MLEPATKSVSHAPAGDDNSAPPLLKRGDRSDVRGLDRQSIANFLVLIIVAAAGLYLVANERMNLWDRDEPRFAQTSRQMLQSHNWVVPTLLDQVRTAKPIFIYWCQAASLWLLGDKPQSPPTPTTVFAVRLPSAAAMILVLILLAVVLFRYAGPKRALWTVLVFSTSFLVIFMAKICLTDAVLLLWTTIALLSLYAIYRGNRAWWLTIVFWCATGLGALTKGPVELGVILTAMMALAAFDFDLQRKGAGQGHLAREVRGGLFVGAIVEFFVYVFKGSWEAARQWWWRLRPLVGVPILAAICVPWMVLISQRDPGFLTTAFMHEVLGRATHAMEQHKGPPGFYIATIFAFFFPWSLLLPAALIVGFRQRRRPQIRFALACILGPWVMLELVATKLPHYLLPAYAPLAFLVSEAIITLGRRFGQRAHRAAVPMAAVLGWSLAVLGLCALPWLAVRWLGQLPMTGSIAVLGLTLVGLLWVTIVIFRFYRRNLAGAAVSMGAGMWVFIAILVMGYIPNAPFLQLPQRLADVLIANGATMHGQELMIGYKELSTIVYQGGTMRAERDEDFLDKTPYRNWPTWIIMSSDLWQKTSPQNKSLLHRVKELEGLNYAGHMKRVNVWVLHK